MIVEIRDSTVVAMALMLSPGFGRDTLRKALEAAYQRRTTIDKLVNEPPEVLGRILDTVTATKILAARPLNAKTAEEMLILYLQTGGRVALVTDAAYPKPLKDLEQPPPMLFYRGSQSLFSAPAGAVVGARKVSGEGLRLAAESAALLAAEGPVVSGGAAGVDLAAHEAAVEVSEGKTILVLPQGLSSYQAPEFIQEPFHDGRVLALSAELPPLEWQTHQAVGRNPIIAALARAVVVIEPDKTGGSIRTAEAALALGRRVFVWGGPRPKKTVDNLLSMGAEPLVDDSGVLRGDVLREALHDEPQKPEDEAFLF